MLAHSADSAEADVSAAVRPSRKVAQILAAARSLFLERDFDAVTMDVVTRASGVSKATLYVHFSSKEELFAAVMAQEASRVTDEIWMPGPDADDVAAVLRRIALNFIDIFMTERALLFRRAIVGAVPRFPAIGRKVFESGPCVVVQRVARFLASADERALLTVPDPALAARQFLSIVRCDIDIKGLLGLNLPAKAEIDAQIESGIQLFLAYYGRKPQG